MLSIALRSRGYLTRPDLLCFALLGDFRGYYKGYSERGRARDFLTWAVLKAYTQNRGGTVALRSADPQTAPSVQFHSFHEGSGDADADLDAVVAGIRFVRKAPMAWTISSRQRRSLAAILAATSRCART